MNLKSIFFAFLLLGTYSVFAQVEKKPIAFSHADTLRGSITPERAWWNLLHYDLQRGWDLSATKVTNKINT